MTPRLAPFLKDMAIITVLCAVSVGLSILLLLPDTAILALVAR